MRKKNVFLFGCILFVQNSDAQKSLVIWDTQPSIIQKIELVAKPVVKILSNKILIVYQEGGVEFEYDNIHRFTFETSAADINVPSQKIDYQQEYGRIVFEGVPYRDDITLYSIGGMRIPVKIEKKGDSLVLPLLGIRPGVYILSICGQTIKIIKK